MSIQVTKKAFEQAMQKAKNLQGKVREASKKTEAVVMSVVETGVTYGVAGAFGYLDGRYGGSEFMGAPGDLLAGGLFHMAGYFGLGGETTTRFLHAAGNGAVSNHAHNLGASMGRVHAVKSKELNPKTGLRKDQPGFVPPSDDEVKAVISGNASGSRLLSDSEMRAFANGA